LSSEVCRRQVYELAVLVATRSKALAFGLAFGLSARLALGLSAGDHGPEPRAGFWA